MVRLGSITLMPSIGFWDAACMPPMRVEEGEDVANCQVVFEVLF